MPIVAKYPGVTMATSVAFRSAGVPCGVPSMCADVRIIMLLSGNPVTTAAPCAPGTRFIRSTRSATSARRCAYFPYFVSGAAM